MASGEKPLPELTTSGGEYLVGPQDFYTIYNENPLLTATTPITGSGATIAVIEETDVCGGQAGPPCNGNDDDATFRSQFGLPVMPPNYLFGADGVFCTDPGILTDGEEGEAALDLQWSGAVAPGATVDFVSCASTSSSAGTDLSAMYIVNNLASTVSSMSYSYGFCELAGGSAAAAFYEAMWEQAAAQGQTVVVSAGDQGSMLCDGGSEFGGNGLSVNSIAASNYNVSAGGTDFSDVYETNGYVTLPASTWWNPTPSTSANGYESALSYVPEITWGGICSNPLLVSFFQNNAITDWGTTYTPEAICNYSYNNTGGDLLGVEGGSGGSSVYNSLPTWQAVYGVGLTSNNTSATQRNLPDVSLFASPGFWGHALPFCESDAASCDFSGSSGGFFAAGGTSFVAPQLNGVMGLVVQATSAFQGNANYNFYNLATTEYGPANGTFAGAACSGSGLGTGVGSTCIFQDVAGDTPNPAGGTVTSDIVQPCGFGTSNCWEGTAGDVVGLSSLSSTTFLDAYPAGQGYDAATGLGSLNINNLVTQWNTSSTGFASTTTITANPALIPPVGGSTTLTATVDSTGRGSIAPALGTITFTDSTSGATLGTAPLLEACSGTPPTYTCSPTTASLTVTSSMLASGANNVVASFPGDGANDSPSQANATVTVVVPVLSVTASPIMLAVNGGQSATINLTVGSSEPAFTGTTTLACSGQPADSICTFSPSSVTSYPTAVTLTVSTTTHDSQLRHQRGWAWATFAMILPGLFLFPAGARNRKRGLWLLAGLTILLALSFSGCGHNKSFQVTVTAASPGATSGQAFIVVTVN